MADTAEPDTEVTMREYVGNVDLDVHDIRGNEFTNLHQPDDYTSSQQFASIMRANDSNGLVYNSVRKDGGECLAAFKPRTVSIPVQGAHYRYVWSGHHQKVVSVLKVTKF